MAFIFRLFQVAVMFVIGGSILCGFTWLLNRGIQFIASQVGVEVGDFFQWIGSFFPKRVKKNKRK